MHCHREAEIRRKAVSNILPCVSIIFRPIEPPMVLQKQALRALLMADDFVDALAKLRIALGHERDADAAVARLPASARILRSVNAGGGDADVHSPRLGG